MPTSYSDRIANRADDLRRAISLSQEACRLVSGDMLVPEAENALELIYEDYGSAIGKLMASLAALDAVEEV